VREMVSGPRSRGGLITERPLALYFLGFLENRAYHVVFPLNSPRVIGPLTGLTVSVREAAFRTGRKDKTCVK